MYKKCCGGFKAKVNFVKTSTDDFWYVNYNGKLGYVLSRYLD